MNKNRKIIFDSKINLFVTILILSLFGIILGLVIINNFLLIFENIGYSNPILKEMKLLGSVSILFTSIEIFFLFSIFFINLKLYIRYKYQFNLIQVIIFGILTIIKLPKNFGLILDLTALSFLKSYLLFHIKMDWIRVSQKSLVYQVGYLFHTGLVINPIMLSHWMF